LSQNYTELNDKVLLDSYRVSGDNKYIGTLLARYSLMVFGVCMKYLKNTADAQDAAQQVFEKAFTEVDKYEIPYFKSWIYTVARNICLMRLRNHRHLLEPIEEFQEMPDLEIVSADELRLKEFLKEQENASLHEALDELNQEQATCIKLFYFEKKSYQEIQHSTGYTFHQVKSHIQNGKRMLRNILGKKSESHERD
jgi:RNA polymerase sigma-70 factor (ECF subfamily)